MKSKTFLKFETFLMAFVLVSVILLSSCSKKEVYNDTSSAVTAEKAENVTDSSEITESSQEETPAEEPAPTPLFSVTEINAIMYPSINLNVRQFPNSNSEVIGNIAKGTEVSVTGKSQNGWYRIKYNDTEGYCYSKYLLSDTSAATAASTPATPSLPQKEVDKSKPYYLKVNLTQNIITVYSKDDTGEFTVPIKAMVCSSGAGGKTPVGTFSTSNKYVWHILNGDVYGQYCTRIVEHYLFHSVPCSAMDKGSLMYNKYNRLGTSASAGCIRLCVADAKWIYDNCPSGTPVTTYYSSDPEPIAPPAPIRIDPNDPRRGWDPTDPDPANPWLTEQQ